MDTDRYAQSQIEALNKKLDASLAEARAGRQAWPTLELSLTATLGVAAIHTLGLIAVVIGKASLDLVRAINTK